MNRRSFLQICVAGTGAVLLPLSFLASPEQKQLGFMREVVVYRIERDIVVLRHDILTKKGQWYVEQGYSEAECQDLRKMEQARAISVELLGNKLKHMGLGWNDLEYLPLPTGYHAQQITI